MFNESDADEKVQDNETESEKHFFFFPIVTLMGGEIIFFLLYAFCVTLQLAINQKASPSQL